MAVKSQGSLKTVRRTATARSRPHTAPDPATVPAEEPVARKKVVLVDGASFYHQMPRRVLGLGKINWKLFVDILMKEVGEGVPSGPPIFTIQPDRPENFVKYLGIAGFDVKLIESAGEEDDKFLIDIVNKLDPLEVESLVLVTRDGSFADAARNAKARGIKIYWVTAQGEGSDGRPILGRQTEILIRDEFNFVDLHAIADRIRLEDWQKREDPRPRQPAAVPSTPPTDVEKTARITFDAQVLIRDLTLIMGVVQPLIERFKIQVHVSSQ